jgi:hypothetical protein
MTQLIPWNEYETVGRWPAVEQYSLIMTVNVTSIEALMFVYLAFQSSAFEVYVVHTKFDNHYVQQFLLFYLYKGEK